MAKISTLLEMPQYFNELIELISKEFHYNSENNVEVDFYRLLNKNNWSNLFLVISDEGALIGHVGVKEFNFVYKNLKLPAAMLGGIAIKSEFQGKGYFRRVFEFVLKKYQEKVGMFFLWSDQLELYRKFGFELGLFQVETEVEFKVNESHKSTFEKLPSNIKDNIKDSYNKKSEKIIIPERNESDWQEIENITSFDVYYSENVFFKNKGADLANIIHESYLFNPKLKEVACSGILWSPFSKEHEGQLTNMAFYKYSNLSIIGHFFNQINSSISYEGSSLFKISDRVVKLSDLTNSLFGPDKIIEFPELYIFGLDSI